MLYKLIKAERLKLKRSPLWMAFIFMPIIPALLGTLNYKQILKYYKVNGLVFGHSTHCLPVISFYR